MLSSMQNGSLDAMCPCPNNEYSILTRGRTLKSLMGFARKDGCAAPRTGRVYVAVEDTDRIANCFLARGLWICGSQVRPNGYSEAKEEGIPRGARIS